MLLPLAVLPCVRAAVDPGAGACAVLEVFFEVAFIVISIGMGIHSLAMLFILKPFSFVGVPVGVLVAATSVCFVVFPFTKVFRTVRPYLLSRTVSLVIEHVTFVDGAVIKDNFIDVLATLFDSLSLQILNVRVICLKGSFSSLSERRVKPR